MTYENYEEPCVFGSGQIYGTFDGPDTPWPPIFRLIEWGAVGRSETRPDYGAPRYTGQGRSAAAAERLP